MYLRLFEKGYLENRRFEKGRVERKGIGKSGNGKMENMESMEVENGMYGMRRCTNEE